MFLRNVSVLVVMALAVYVGGVALSPRPADAATDLTGSWTFDWAGAPGPSPIPCTSAAVKQHGTDLYIYFTCPPGNVFSGTFNKGTGYFTITTTYLCKGFIETPFTLTGTVSPDGNSMSGAWSTICIYPINGTFSADRSGPATVTFTPPPAPTTTPTPTSPPAFTLTPTATATCGCLPTATPTPPPIGGVSGNTPAHGGDTFTLSLIFALAALASCTALASALWYARRSA